MPLPARHDLNIYRGDTVSVRLRLWTDAEQTVPFTIDAVMVFSAQIRPAPGDPVSAAFTVVPEVGSNEVTLTILPVVCDTLPAAGRWDCQVDYLADNTLVQTVAAGTVTVEDDITRAGTLRRAGQRV